MPAGRKALTMKEYATKESSALLKALARWVQEATGFDPENCDSKLDAFNEGVRLSNQLRAAFSKSDASSVFKIETLRKKVNDLEDAKAKLAEWEAKQKAKNLSVVEDENDDTEGDDDEGLDLEDAEENSDEEVEEIPAKPSALKGKNRRKSL